MEEDKRKKIELGIIAFILLVFFVSIFIAVEPFEVFERARNNTRRMHMEDIMTAMDSYVTDQQGFYPDCMPNQDEDPVPIVDCQEELDGHLTGEFPTDPNEDYEYMFERVEDDRVRVFSTAPEAENVEVIR